MPRRRVVRSAVQHISRQVKLGHTLAAADHLLVRESKNDIPEVIHDLTRQFSDLLNERHELEEHIFNTLIRLGLNLVGQDAEVARIPPRARDKALRLLRQELRTLEDSWSDSARNTVRKFLAGMSSVNAGDSIPGYMAEQILKYLSDDVKPSRFVDAFASVSRETVYWKMVEKRLCKFGNDYARGLEILRHLGFSQVSTNPVLAAKAFDEDPGLMSQMETEVLKNPSWIESPDEHGHQIAMAGTLLALWPNLEVFRPLAVLVGNSDYMVSFQLNPNVADNVKASLENARRAYRLARDHLAVYDRSLGVPTPGRLGPNIVFKVAGSSAAALEVTRRLNASGIGTNNTVTYTVAQEVPLILAALEGKATALKSRRSVTRTYETNMGGRFVSHLRETEARKIFTEIAKTKGVTTAIELVMDLAKGIGLNEADLERVRSAPGIVEKADLVCAFKNLKSLTHNAFLDAVERVGLSRFEVEQLENDIRKAGTLVARRVYSVFYTKANHPNWVDWLARKYKIRRVDASRILSSMDILPASKRIPEDTYDTLGWPNSCNTEFPNHAKAVQVFSQRSDFQLESYRNAILRPAEPSLLERLMRVEDFVRAYESTEEVSGKLVEAGVLSRVEELGLRGITPGLWSEFGPVKKTMTEFKNAYERFLERCVEIARKQSRGVPQELLPSPRAR